MCIRQASMFNDLRSRLISHGFTNIDYKIINMAEGIDDLKKLEAASPHIPVLQETSSDKACNTLGAGKDHFLILDSCNRLVYQVIMPWSFLFYPYVKAAILSAYNDKPCGDCDGHQIAHEHVTVTIIKHVHLPEIFQATFKPPSEYKHEHKKDQYYKHHHHDHHHHHHHPEYHNFLYQGSNQMTVNEQYDALKQFLMHQLVLVGVGNEAIPVHTQGTQEDYTKYYTVVNTDASTLNTASEHNVQSEVFKDVVVHTDELTKIPDGTDPIRVELLEGSIEGHNTGSVDEFLSPNAPTHQIILWYPHHHIYKGERQKDHFYIVLNSKNPDYHGHVVPGKEEGKVVVGQTFEGEREHYFNQETGTTFEDSHKHGAVQTGETTQTGGSTVILNTGGVTSGGEHTEHQSAEHSYSYNTTHTETHHHSSFGTEHSTNEITAGDQKTNYHDKTVTGTNVVEGQQAGVSHGTTKEDTSMGFGTSGHGHSVTVTEHHESDITTVQSQGGTSGSDIHHAGANHEGTVQTHTDQSGSATGEEHGHQTVTGTTTDEGGTAHVVTDGVHGAAGHTSHSTSDSASSAQGDITHSTSQSSSHTSGGATYSTSFSSSSSSSNGGQYYDGDIHKGATTTGEVTHGQSTIVHGASGVTGQDGHHSNTHGDTAHSTNTLHHSTDGQTHTGSSTVSSGTTIGSGTHESSSSHTTGTNSVYGQTGTHTSTIQATDTHKTTGHGTTTYTTGSQGSQHSSTGQSTFGQNVGSHGMEGHSTSGQTISGGSSGYGGSTASHTSSGYSAGSHTTDNQVAHGSHGQSTDSHTSGQTVGGGTGTSGYDQTSTTHTSFGQSTDSHSTTAQSGHGSHSQSSDGHSSTGHMSSGGSGYGQSSGSHTSFGHSSTTGSQTSDSHSSYGQSGASSQTSGSYSSFSGKKDSQTSGSHSSYGQTTSGQNTHTETSSGHGFFSGGHSSSGYGQSSGSHGSHSQTTGSHSSQGGSSHYGHSESHKTSGSGGHGKGHGGHDDRIIFRDDSREDLNFYKYLEQYAHIKPNKDGMHSRTLDEEETPEKSKEGKELISHYSKILPWIQYPVD